jgi:hypothetical protein
MESPLSFCPVYPCATCAESTPHKLSLIQGEPSKPGPKYSLVKCMKCGTERRIVAGESGELFAQNIQRDQGGQ